MKRLYFIRHGESEFNKAHKWAGSSDTPLTPKGHEQATLAGKIARDEGMVFDVIIASPLQRATTAELLQNVIHVMGDPQLSHEKVMALGERLGQVPVLFLTAMAAHAAQIRLGRELVDRAGRLTDEQRGWLPDPVALERVLGHAPDEYVMGGAIHDSFGEITSRMLEEGSGEDRHSARHQAESLVLLGAALGGEAGQRRLAELNEELGYGVAFARLHAYFGMLVRQISHVTGLSWADAVTRVADQLRADAR